jgi:hypothetical protein
MALTATETFNQNPGSRGSGVLVVRINNDAAGGSTTIALNGTSPSANTSTSETVIDMSIAEIVWGNDQLTTITRNGIEVFRAAAGSGHMDFAHSQLRLEEEALLNQDIVVNTNTGNATVLLKIHKRS